jgi:CDP-glucose 4,6-dehydratase
MRAVNTEVPVEIRFPGATRPWQHVLEPLSGYLLLAQKLLEGNIQSASGWNFGPSDEGSVSVEEVVTTLRNHWPEIKYNLGTGQVPHEANLLKLDCSKAHLQLGWEPVWDNQTMFLHTSLWYRNFYQRKEVNTFSDIETYVNDALDKKLIWAL